MGRRPATSILQWCQQPGLTGSGSLGHIKRCREPTRRIGKYPFHRVTSGERFLAKRRLITKSLEFDVFA